jgi:hypothetical protein
MESINHKIKLIEDYRASVENLNLIQLSVIRKNAGTAAEFVTEKPDIEDLGYNIFEIISDKYHHENFHSDIIASLLDYRASHNEGEKYLQKFISFLNLHYQVGLHSDDYKDSIISTEKPGRIDISICNPYSKKAIIIENKINNARDMSRQLPRYYDAMVQAGYTPQAIIYLTLDRVKQPDYSDWSESDKKKVLPLLRIVNAYTGSAKDLYNGWLLECHRISVRLDSITVLRQYIKLIKHLGVSHMDTFMLENLFDSLSKNEKDYRAAISLKLMLEKLPIHLAQRIQDKYKYKSNPFGNPWIYRDTTAVLGDWSYHESQLALDIQCSLDGYLIMLFDRGQNSESVDKLVETIDMGSELSFDSSRGRHVKQFKIENLAEAEKELFEFLDNFLIKIKQLDDGLSDKQSESTKVDTPED